MTPIAALATAGGAGRAPFAPGTAGSLIALPFAWGLGQWLGHEGLFAVALIFFVAMIPVCTRYARECGREDPGECVIDEVAGQWIACAYAPLTPLGFALAFILFRLFDMTKIWPVSAGERLKGGLGIMADDGIAGLMAGAICAWAGYKGWV